MHVIAILVMTLSTFAFISAFATSRRREHLIPVRIKRRSTDRS